MHPSASLYRSAYPDLTDKKSDRDSLGTAEAFLMGAEKKEKDEEEGQVGSILIGWALLLFLDDLRCPRRLVLWFVSSF